MITQKCFLLLFYFKVGVKKRREGPIETRAQNIGPNVL